MGAILAVFGEAGDPELPERLERMLACSPYRGVPARHVDGGVALGVQARGDDASLAQRGHLTVAFTGWIGNWDELAGDSGLDLRGSLSDADRLAVAFEAWGKRAFAGLRGEFAAVIADRRTSTVTAARDVYGMRPLFFQCDAGRSYVASEIGQVLVGSGRPPRLDEAFLASWLVYRYGDGGDTMFLGVRQVVPGHGYVFPLAWPDGEPRRTAYWEPPREEPARGRDEASYAEELRTILDRAVGRTLAAMPGAVALSGGMDSPTIWALTRRRAQQGDRRAGLVDAVTLAFPGFACDESALVGEILTMTGGEGVSVDATAVAPFDLNEALAREAEGPFLATLYHGPLFMAAARERGWRVLYFGFGGDEWLTGTPHYLGDELRRGHLLRVLTDARRLSSGTRHMSGRELLRGALAPMAGFPWRRGRGAPAWLPPARRAALPRRPLSRTGSRAGVALENRLALLRALSFSSSSELVAARAGVEMRSPFHDLDVIEFAFRTPGRAFMSGKLPKHLLRVAMEGLLPTSVIGRRDLSDLHPPIRRGLRELASRENVASWCLIARRLVVAGEAERMRAEVAADEGASSFDAFGMLVIAERLCERFAAETPGSASSVAPEALLQER